MVAGKPFGAGRQSEQALVDRWRELLGVHARTLCELDRALHRHGLGASDFEVLDVLIRRAGPGGRASYRVQEIAERVHLSQSALSRLIGRLERDGLVARGMCSEDRRGVQVCLTDKGRELHGAVLPVQRAVLARMLEDGSPGGDGRTGGGCSA
jgi:DNA-binding MarR family transcriptional regulator